MNRIHDTGNDPWRCWQWSFESNHSPPDDQLEEEEEDRGGEIRVRQTSRLAIGDDVKIEAFDIEV